MVEQQEDQILSPLETGTADVAQEAEAISEGVTVNGFFIRAEEVEQAVYIYLPAHYDVFVELELFPPEQKTVAYYITQDDR